MESGLVSVKDKDLNDLLVLYRVGGGERQDLLALAKQSRSAGWWAEFPDLQGPRRHALERESEGEILQIYDPTGVPALLQTPEYARALCEASDARRLTGRGGINPVVLAHRRKLMDTDDPPRLWVVIPEYALWRAPGDDEDVLRGQVRWLRSMASRDNISLQIALNDSSANLLASNAFTLIRLGGEDGTKDVVLIEEMTTFDVAVDLPRIDAYRKTFLALSTHALDPGESLRVLDDPGKWMRDWARQILEDGDDSPR